MVAIASLGDITIEVTEGLESIRESGRQNFAQHRKLQGKPTLQQVGGRLDTISFEFRLHPMTTDDPAARLQQWKDMRDAAQPQSLVINNQFKGQWVINSIDARPMRIDVNSGAEILQFSVRLLEYVGVVVIVNEPEADRTIYRQPSRGRRA